MIDLRKVKKVNISSRVKRGITIEDIISKKENKKLRNELEISREETTKVLTFDIESWGLVPDNLAIGIFFDGVKYDVFYTIQDVIDYIDTLDFNKIIIFAHNGAKFDYGIFFEKILNEEYKLIKYGDVLKLEYKNKKGGKVIFRDTIYMLQGSLDSLGKDFSNNGYKGVTPLKFINPIKYGFNREEFNKNPYEFNIKNVNDEDIEYCKQDCKVLYNIVNNPFVLDYLDILNNNTIASVSFEKLQIGMIESRKEFYQSKGLSFEELTSFDIRNSFDSCFREVYKGGLTFVLNHFSNDEDILTLDVNSMYPGSMTQAYPDTSKLEVFHYDSLKNSKLEWLEMIKDYPNGLSNVVIKIRDNLSELDKEIVRTIPLIQYAENGGMNYFNFSDGKEYRLTILNEEINLILEFFEINVELSIHCKKENLYYPFKKYMESTYKEREESKLLQPAKAQILKLLMNSSYGRLGMQNQKDKMMINTIENIKKWLEEVVKDKLNIYENKVFKTNEMYQHIKKFVDNSNQKNIDEWDYDLFKKHNDIDEELLYLTTFININENMFNQLKITNFRKIDDTQYIVSTKTKKVESKESNFCLASHITSKSRVQLIRMMIKIKREGLGEVCYCDTDSVHIKTNKIKELELFLKEDIDPKTLGKWKNEGVYDVGVWLAKKHYYLFKRDELDRLVLSSKVALKGFRIEKDIDYFIENRSVEVVKKLYTRLTHLEIKNQNQIYDNKSFMNFTINTNKENELFPYVEYSEIQNQIDEKREILQNLFYSMCDNVYVKNDDEIVKVSEIKNQRMEELNNKIEENKEQGLYDITGIDIIPESIKSKIEKGFKKKKEVKKYIRPSRAKAKIGIENIEEFLKGA